MESLNEELMPGMSSNFNDDNYEELWVCILNTKGRYELSKNQARIVAQAMATGERGSIMFETFAIPLAYVAEFYREKKWLKGVKALPAKATEEEYIPMDPVKWEKMKQDLYRKLGKTPKKSPTIKEV